MSDFIIHGIPGSPYVRAVLIALEEKGAAWQLAALPMGGHRSEAYRAYHPFQKIPAMEHSDFALYETHAMLRYIDAVATGAALVPADPRAAARMDQMIGIVNCYLMPTVSGVLSFNRRIAPLLGLPVDEAAVAAGMDPARHVLDVASDLLGGEPFFGGDTPSLADCMTAPHVSFLTEYDEGHTLLAERPALKSWIERMLARASLQATTWDALIARTGVNSKAGAMAAA